MFRLGATAGGNQNLARWVKNARKKSELPLDLARCGDGHYQGGASALVSLGLSYAGKGALRFAPAKTKINAATYLDIAENAYLPDCHALYGAPPSCAFQQDGASSHTANAVQQFCAEKFPRFWNKPQWPANSPDLNPLDYFAWGYLQAQVDKQKPACLDALKLAIKKCVDDMPLDMAQRAIMGFRKRAKLCIAAEGGPFKGKKLAGEGELLIDHPVVDHGAGEELDSADELGDE